MTTSYHVSLCVRGAIKWPNKQLKGLFKHPDGRKFTADESKDKLMEELLRGHEMLPCSPCDNWDWKTGCGGHKE